MKREKNTTCKADKGNYFNYQKITDTIRRYTHKQRQKYTANKKSLKYRDNHTKNTFSFLFLRDANAGLFQLVSGSHDQGINLGGGGGLEGAEDGADLVLALLLLLVHHGFLLTASRLIVHHFTN